LTAAGLPPFAEKSVEVLGAETSYGARSRARDTREVVLKLAARHANREALEIFAREVFPAASAMAASRAARRHWLTSSGMASHNVS
jgi:hypothetical protein